MTLNDKLGLVFIITLFYLSVIPWLFVCLKNRKAITKGKQNVLAWFVKWVAFLAMTVILFLPQTRAEQDYFMSLIVGYVLALVFTLLIPGKTIELIKMAPHRTADPTPVATKVVFKKEFNYMKFLWHGRFLLVIIPLVILFLI